MSRNDKQFQEHINATHGEPMAKSELTVHALKQVLDEAYTEAIGPNLRRITAENMKGILASPQFIAGVKELIRKQALLMVEDILAADLISLEERVRKLINDQFEAQVSQAAHRYLEDKLAEIKRKLG